MNVLVAQSWIWGWPWALSLSSTRYGKQFWLKIDGIDIRNFEVCADKESDEPEFSRMSIIFSLTHNKCQTCLFYLFVFCLW
jgi:hypothetical protein